MEPNSRNRDLTYLNQLSTEELETMLRADLYAPDGGDSELALAIMEVILERENEDEDSRQAQTQQAWEEFQQYYRDPEGKGVSLYPEEETDSGCETSDTEPPLASPRRRSTPRRILIAVALIAALMAASLIPIFGYKNAIQMVATWTADQFTFRSMGAYVEPTQEELEYSQLKEELKEYGIEEAVLPKIPEGFCFDESKIWEHPENGQVDIKVLYRKETEYIIVNIFQNKMLADKWHEKDLKTVGSYSKGEIDYYIFNNNAERIIVWQLDNLECAIYTSLSVSEVEQIIG